MTNGKKTPKQSRRKPVSIVKCLDLTLVSLLMIVTACKGNARGFNEGVYKCVYGRDSGTYEVVELQENRNFRQKFYMDGQLRFSNSGKWQFVESNRGHTAKWPDNRSIIVFTDWLSAEELLRRERIGESPDVSVLQKEKVAALVRDSRRFAFDEDGGSDYKRR